MTYYDIMLILFFFKFVANIQDLWWANFLRLTMNRRGVIRIYLPREMRDTTNLLSVQHCNVFFDNRTKYSNSPKQNKIKQNKEEKNILALALIFLLKNQSLVKNNFSIWCQKAKH